MTIFDIINDITYIKSGNLDKNPDFSKTMNNYMMVRWLSMSDELMPYIEQIERYYTVLDIIEFYHFLCKYIPKKRVFLKYIKRKD